jgi:hypothetical protein
MMRLFASDQLPMEDQGILIAGYDNRCLQNRYVDRDEQTNRFFPTTHTFHIQLSCISLLHAICTCIYKQCVHIMSVQYVLIYKQCIHLMWARYIVIHIQWEQCIHYMWVQYRNGGNNGNNGNNRNNRNNRNHGNNRNNRNNAFTSCG